MPNVGEIRKSEELGYKSINKTKHMWCVCPGCKKERWVQIRANKPISHFCRVCANSGDRNPIWKGGRYVHEGGHIMIKLLPDNPFIGMAHKSRYILEHRYVMAQHLGRCLGIKEIVHHKNGIKDDNRIENLELSAWGQHQRDHHKGYQDGYTKGCADGHASVKSEMVAMGEWLDKWYRNNHDNVGDGAISWQDHYDGAVDALLDGRMPDKLPG